MERKLFEVTTDYQSKFWANQLVLQNASDSVESLSRSIANARVELNPHQVDASLFAFRSPLSKGVILADEVGLGKTIEAGIVILQKWAERKRNILLILPATLRTQWQQELADKFFLPSIVLEAKTFNEFKKEGNPNPFNQKNRIVICSYHFASNKARELAGVKWDLVVIDEAHRLRNVYKTSNKLAKNIRQAVMPYPKILLTATPLQNTLLELYGMVSFIDDHVFGDQKTFRDQFVNIIDDQSRNIQLRERIKPICTRTLRKQVLEYVPYTKRISKLHEFTPTDEEHKLYEEVSAYLQKDVLYALPAAQRQLMTLVVRKLLASSTVAIAQTLRRLISRLEDSLAEIEPELAEDFEGLDEIAEEWSEDEEEADDVKAAPVDQSLLKQELEQLRGYLKMAETIQHNTKGDALLKVLKEAFRVVEESKAAHKAVVFTESKRTQKFLYDLLSANGYEGKVAMLNGENNDDRSKEILKEWKVRHEGTEKVTGLRTVDMKAAVVEEFRDRATILIATEAAAEGVNLQFCSLVVNYDLPWNPQRIEQRIGRCHRYGQKHDVVVWNFKNMRNAADQRVYQLLSEKFRLFDGVFGSSDEVLGALESGVDIEKQIAQIYQNCRTPEQIQFAFDDLQTKLEEKVSSGILQAKKAIIDNLDEEVAARLKIHERNTKHSLDERGRWLYEVTRHELNGDAAFDGVLPRFEYKGSLGKPGFYHMQWPEADKHNDIFFRQEHALAQAVIQKALDRPLEAATLVLDYSAYPAKITALEPFIGKSGFMRVSKLTVKSFETIEYLLVAAVADDGQVIEEELACKLLNIPARVDDLSMAAPQDKLEAVTKTLHSHRQEEIEKRNSQFFDEEVSKLDLWSEDLKAGLEVEIKDIDKEIREQKKEAAKVTDVKDKLEKQKELRKLEQKRKTMRQRLYEEQDKIDAQRDEMIARVEQQLASKVDVQEIFTIRWQLSAKDEG